MTTWKDIPSFEGLYQVSEDGQIKSLGRTTIGGSGGGPCMKTYPPKMLVYLIGDRNRGRARVNLYYNTKGAGAKKKIMYVVDIVQAVFGEAAAKSLPNELQKRK